MNRIISTTILAIISITVFAQNVPFEKDYFRDRKKEFKDARSAYDQGISFFETEQYYLALNEFIKAGEFNPNNAYLNYVTGISYLFSVQAHKSLQHFLKAKELDVAVSRDIDFYIGRGNVDTKMKVLVTDGTYPHLNNFKMLLGLSDRLMRTDSDFYRTPHTTRIIWGGHRVVYIFTESTGRISLYYDIELHAPIEGESAGGSMFPTTTLVTKNRIFVPVPDQIIDAFRIVSGPKEFLVRYDTLVSDIKE